MKKGPIFRAYLCQLLILALLGYGLDLTCMLAGGCEDEGACCTDCFLPAHPTDKADHAVHLKFIGPAPNPPTDEWAVVFNRPLVEIAFHVVELPPRRVCSQLTDPVRGPPAT